MKSSPFYQKNMTDLTEEQIKEFIDRRFCSPNADSGTYIGNHVELKYRIGNQSEIRTIIQCVGGQDDLKENRFDGKTATEGEAWNMFEKANPNAMVIEANLL